MKDLTLRIVMVVFLGVASIAFTYNQIAQARAARYRTFGDTPSIVYVDTWSGQICRLSGSCAPLRR